MHINNNGITIKLALHQICILYIPVDHLMPRGKRDLNKSCMRGSLLTSRTIERLSVLIVVAAEVATQTMLRLVLSAMAKV